MKNRLYMVSAWSEANDLCLGQEKVNAKSNEITAIPRLIDALDLRGCIVTIDAIAWIVRSHYRNVEGRLVISNELRR